MISDWGEPDEDNPRGGRRIVSGRGPDDDDIQFGDPEPDVNTDDLPSTKDAAQLAKEIRDDVQRTVYNVLKKKGRRSRKMKVTATGNYVTVDVPF